MNLIIETTKIITDNILRIVGGSISWIKNPVDRDVVTLKWEKRTNRDDEQHEYLEYRLAIMQITEVKDPSVIANMVLQAIFAKYPNLLAYQNSRHVTISPTRQYVATCISFRGGYYFQKFTLPMEREINNSEEASWYFLNRLDYTAFIQGCFTFEDFTNLKSIDNVEE